MGNKRVCDVCNKERAEKIVICDSEKCALGRLLAYQITDKYFPTHGCDNCWGDLGHGCDEKCRQEFQDSLKFGQDIWVLIHYLMEHPRSDELFTSTIAKIKEEQDSYKKKSAQIK